MTVDLTCVNDARSRATTRASGTEDTALVISDLTDLTGNDTDVDAGTTLAIAGISNPVGGTISYDFLADSITFTPTANLCGPGAGRFDYTVTDGTAIDTGHVTIDITCVNDNPVAGDDVATVQQDSGAADHDVLGNDSDVDGDTPSLTGATIDAPAHGTASVNGTKVSYTPAAGFAGTAVITYTIGDGHGGTDTGTLTVTVNPAGVDTTPPAPTVPALAIGAVGRVDTTAPVVISWSATDAGSGVASYLVQVSVGGHPYKTIYSGTGHSIRQVYAFNKSIVVRVRATDHDGNTSGWVPTPEAPPRGDPEHRDGREVHEPVDVGHLDALLG